MNDCFLLTFVRHHRCDGVCRILNLVRVDVEMCELISNLLHLWVVFGGDEYNLCDGIEKYIL